MFKVKFLILIFANLLLFFSFSAVKAQDELPPDAPNRRADRENRPNLFAELGLTAEQRQQIRRINTEKRPLARGAQQRLREATENLDQAIYAVSVNENEIAARLKEVQTAQAEVTKIRSTIELAVRRILTAEQLSKFRDLRRQFAQRMESNRDEAPPRPMRNLKRFKLRQNQSRPND